jgi:hypothetical protein
MRQPINAYLNCDLVAEARRHTGDGCLSDLIEEGLRIVIAEKKRKPLLLRIPQKKRGAKHDGK